MSLIALRHGLQLSGLQEQKEVLKQARFLLANHSLDQMEINELTCALL